jgi:hypothetical protein
MVIGVEQCAAIPRNWLRTLPPRSLPEASQKLRDYQCLAPKMMDHPSRPQIMALGG